MLRCKQGQNTKPTGRYSSYYDQPIAAREILYLRMRSAGGGRIENRQPNSRNASKSNVTIQVLARDLRYRVSYFTYRSRETMASRDSNTSLRQSY